MKACHKLQLVNFFFGKSNVRVFIDDYGDFWFVAKDVCLVLGLEKNVGQAISHLDDDEKCFIDPNIFIGDVGMDKIFEAGGFPAITAIPEAGKGGRPLAFVSESGLYSLVFRSRKPEAKAFSKWVRSEVLPALRKTGRYEMGQCANPRGRIIRQNVATPFPDEMPDEVLALRPYMRQTLWHQALQTARLESADASYAWEVFMSLCRMVGAKNTTVFAAVPEKTQQLVDLVSLFAKETLVSSPGGRITAGQLYKAFRIWMEGRGASQPSQRLFGEIMGTIYGRIRSNGTWYIDVAFRKKAAA